MTFVCFQFHQFIVNFAGIDSRIRVEIVSVGRDIFWPSVVFARLGLGWRIVY